MKRNMNLVRDILLSVEEVTTPNVKWMYRYGDSVPQSLAKYSQEEVEYHVSLCEESGLICGVAIYNGGLWIDVSDLTPAGHDFLSNIRDDAIWKKVFGSVKSASLGVFVDLAEKVVRSQFGL